MSKSVSFSTSANVEYNYENEEPDYNYARGPSDTLYAQKLQEELNEEQKMNLSVGGIIDKC